MSIPSQARPHTDHYVALRLAHVEDVRRALGRHSGQIAASHESAGIAQGLATYDIPSRAHLTRTAGSRRNGRLTKVDVAELLADDVRRVNGLWVTSPARTVIDLGRNRPFLNALVTADAALRSGVRRDELEQLLVRMWNWPGIRPAAEVVRWADPLAESPLESVIRGRCILLGLPVPTLQHRFELTGGREIWSDLWWEEFATAGEADGRTKYDGADGPKVLWREKERRDLLEECCHVIRWTWAQAHAPDEVFRDRLLIAFARGERLRQALRPRLP